MSSLPATIVAPAKLVRGRLRVPGDKSISHRYALLAATAEGTSRLLGYAPGADCRSTLSCLAALGVSVSQDAEGVITLVGRGFDAWRSPSRPLDAGNSGTTMRMLMGLVAAQSFVTAMIGDESLSRRPMRRVIEPLTQMGARIDATDGHAPLAIHGTRLKGIAYTTPVPSAQDRKSTRLNSSHIQKSRMPSSA